MAATIRASAPRVNARESRYHSGQLTMYMIALIIAATIPMPPAKTATVLAMPPRTPGARASKTPSKPAMMATIANTNPKNAPLVKLQIAAITAINDGILKDALRETVVVAISDHYHRFFPGQKS
jgi:hypothetical protein